MKTAAELFYHSSMASRDCKSTQIFVAGNQFCLRYSNPQERAVLVGILKMLDLLEFRYQERGSWLTRLVSNKVYASGQLSRLQTLTLIEGELQAYCDARVSKRKGVDLTSFLERMRREAKEKVSLMSGCVLVRPEWIPGDKWVEENFECVDVYRMNFGESLIDLSWFDKGISVDSIDRFWALVADFFNKKTFVIENTSPVPCLKGFGFLAEDVQSAISKLNKY